MLHEINLSRADLNLLVLFETVLAERHVGRAAARLNLSPSALSHGLGRLRALLDDPLFLKHPKGVVPTARALELAGDIGEVLAGARRVLGGVERFDPQRSARRFAIGMPDAISTVVLPTLLTRLAALAPLIDLSVQELLPHTALDELDMRKVDLAVQPLEQIPPRFHAVPLYDEEFVIAMRVGHPLAGRLTLDRYCAASHLLVSLTGDPRGNVDAELARIGRTRRVAATVPHFLHALALVGETDLLVAVPRGQAVMHAARFGITLAKPPRPLAPLARSPVSVVASKAAMADAGVAWLVQSIVAAARDQPAGRSPASEMRSIARRKP